jgi:phosphatidylglycerophosphatase A
VKRTAATALASVLGCGRFPVSPGTAGSAVAILLGAPMLLGPPWLLPLMALLATIGGLWAVQASGARDDPGWVVIDEVAGQWIALLGLASPNPWGLLLALVLFRFFDITKLGPIGWADRQHGAFGVMADDVIAGAIVAVIVFVARLHWPNGLG